MKTHLLAILLGLGFCFSVYGQTKPNTNDKGTLFFQFSYNSSIYSKANVDLEAENYAITLKNVQIRDNYEGKGLESFFSSSSPQFGMKLGFYVQRKWAITLSFDRYNTFFVDKQNIQLNGTIAPHSNAIYSGEYSDKEIVLDRNEFHLQQREGMNYFAIGVQRADQIYKTRSSAFSFQTVYGVKLGSMLTKVDYTYNGITQQGISSFGGIGVAANVGLRFNFVNHLFLQIGADGGFFNQGNIKTTTIGKARAKQAVGFFSPNISVGFSVSTTGEDCDCPKW